VSTALGVQHAMAFTIQYSFSIFPHHLIIGMIFEKRTLLILKRPPGVKYDPSLRFFPLTFYTGCPRRNVPDVGRMFLTFKVHRYNPKHLYPKLNGYEDNGQRKVWSSGGSMHCNLSAYSVQRVCPRVPCQITEIPLTLKQ
jgi:hypothetical protein